MVYIGVHESEIGDSDFSTNGVTVGNRIAPSEIRMGSYIFDSSLDFFERDHPSYVVLGLANGVNSAQVLVLPHFNENEEYVSFSVEDSVDLAAFGSISELHRYEPIQIQNAFKSMRKYDRQDFDLASIRIRSFFGQVRELYFGKKSCEEKGIDMKLRLVRTDNNGPFALDFVQRREGKLDLPIGKCTMQSFSNVRNAPKRRHFVAHYFIDSDGKKKRMVKGRYRAERIVGLDAAIERMLRERDLAIRQSG